mgnify:FL=1
MEQKIYRAACYCRLSDDDANDGMSVSIDTQMTIHKQYCQQNKIQIVDFYCDDGFTGTNFERPAFKRMMNDVKSHRVNTVIVKDLSRFGRESIYVNYYTQMFFPENNVTFIIIADNTVISPNSRYDIMLSLKSAINEMYPAEVSDKVRQAFSAKAKNGEFLHPFIPYGYEKSQVERNKLIIDEEYAPIVKQIFEMVAYKGLGAVEISKYLYENQIPSPAALRQQKKGDFSHKNPYSWNKSSINNLLHNEVYMGKIILGKTRKVNFKSQKVVHADKSDWIVCENAHEPIISQELFDEVQARLEVRRRDRKPQYTENIFRSVIRCADCGSPMYIISPKGGNRSTYFVCGKSQNRKGDPTRCTTHNIKYDDLSDAVLSDVNSLIGTCNADNKRFTDQILEYIRANNPDIGSINAEIDSLEARIKKESSKYKRLYDDYYEGVIKNHRMFEEMSSECNDRIEAYTAKLEKLRKDMETSEGKLSDANKFLELVRRFTERETLDQEILNTLIDRIEVNEKEHTDNGVVQNICIYYKFVGKIKTI